MSRLDELIQQLCPNGVEYISIGDLINNKRIKSITPSFKIKRKDYKENGSTPIISQEAEYISGYCDEVDKNITDKNYVCFGDHSEHIKYVNFAFVQGADGLKIMYTDESHLVARYFYHAALSFYKKHCNYERHFKYFSETIIPVPPLDVQREIVRILDNFTELTARKKQYEYYRDKLLTFDGATSEAVWQTIGDVASVTKLTGFEFTNFVRYSDSGKIIALRGLNVKNGKLDLSDVKYIDGSDLSKLGRSKLKIGDMLFTYVGTVGQVALIDENDKFYLAPNVAMIRLKVDYILPEYMRYYFQSSHFYKKQILRLLQSSSMQNIPMEKIRKFEIPVPPYGCPATTCGSIGQL